MNNARLIPKEEIPSFIHSFRSNDEVPVSITALELNTLINDLRMSFNLVECNDMEREFKS